MALEEQSNKNLKVFFIILGVCLIIQTIIIVFNNIGISTISYNFKKGKSEYKSITHIEKTAMDTMPGKEALDLLIKQDSDLQELVSKKTKKNIDLVFETFYLNLCYFAGAETELNSKFSFPGYEMKGSTQNINGITVNKIKNKEDESFNIVTPKTELFKLVYSGEGYWSAEINYDYLAEKYLAYLSAPWRDFLELKKQEFKDKKGGSYYQDGAVGVTKNDLVNWLIAYRTFIDKYPQFPLIETFKNDFKIYVSDFIQDTYQTFTFDDPERLMDSAKQAYEKFLSKANKNTDEYKKIKEWYEILKKDNFILGINYYKYKYDLTGDDFYKEKYEEILREKNETWKKVGEHLYFDTNSVVIQGDDYVSGTFKEYSTSSNKFEKNENATYQIIETAAFCNLELQDGVKKLEFPIYKFYDENNKFLSEDNIHEYWRNNYPDGHLGITHPEDEHNGDIYFNVLCSYANKH